eukprot:TRINITY_DN9735_c0_g1_i1.p1 TRINITY_DN9735_c0_g1~~TRINITY_DN9735_c0_g1_i1.p1  ORF type:complete len:291 (+),score=17.56 TRINITY_DN9735_c0_g1_i1:71-874(+)
MAFENDKERFRTMFAHKDNEERHAVICLNLHLRESSGTNISVEVFGVRFKRLDGVPNYILGIRESSGTNISVEVFGVRFKRLDGVPNYILGIRENAEEVWMAPLRQAQQPTRQRRQRRTARHAIADSNPPNTVLGASSGPRPACDTQSRSSDSLIDSPSASTITKDNNNADARQQWQPTGSGAKLQSMLELMSVWSVIVSGTTCCAFHASLEEAKNVIRTMRRGPCQPAFYDDERLQCGVCGILNDPTDNRQCTLCESDLLAARLAL